MEHQIRKTFTKGQSRVVSVEVVRKRRFQRSQTDNKDNQVSHDKSQVQTSSAAKSGADAPDKSTQATIKKSDYGRAVDSRDLRNLELAQVLQKSFDKKLQTDKTQFSHDPSQVPDEPIEEKTDSVSFYNADEEPLSPDSIAPVVDAESDQNAFRKRKKTHRKNVDDFQAETETEILDKKSEKRHLDRLKHQQKYEQKYNKLDVENLSSDDFLDEEEGLEDGQDLLLVAEPAAVVKKPKVKSADKKPRVKTAQIQKIISLQPDIKIRDLIQKLQGKKEDLVQKINNILGRQVSVDDTLDIDTSVLLVSDLGYKYSIGQESRTHLEYLNMEDDSSRTKPKIPVVTVVGHVDHGKTTLLDALRSTSCVQKEHGGITQCIGADLVNIHDRKVTFIDTPGHELFMAMRKKGVQVTDIAVLIVAANDSVKLQTIEAIKHIQEAEVPVVVAINKCDLPGANPDKVIQDLVQHGLLAESLGGKVLTVNISAKNHEGLDKLMEVILLQAEMQDLKYDPERSAEVYILDCWLKKGLGNMMNGIVTAGVLRPQDIFVVSDVMGKVGKLYDSTGAEYKDAVPAGCPVLISGCKERVRMGSKLVVVPNEYTAKRICNIRRYEAQVSQMEQKKEAVNDVMQILSSNNRVKCRFFLKAKSILMLNTLEDLLTSFNDDKYQVKIIGQDIGNVTLPDVQMAHASAAHVIKFDVDMDTAAKKFVSKADMTVYDHNIIYHLLRDIEDLFKRLEAENAIHNHPRAKILKVFNIKNRKIAGCILEQGSVTRNNTVQILRNNKVIATDKILSLHRYDDSIETVNQDEEFGVQLQNFDNFVKEDYLLFT